MNKIAKPMLGVTSIMDGLTEDQLALTTFMCLRKRKKINSNIGDKLFTQGLTLISEATYDSIAQDDNRLDIDRIMVSVYDSGIHPSQLSPSICIKNDDLIDLVQSNIIEVIKWVESVKLFTDGYDLTNNYNNHGAAQGLALNVAHLLQGYAFNNEGGGLEDDFIYKVITGRFGVCNITKDFEVKGYHSMQVDRDVRTVLITLGRLILKSIASGWLAAMATDVSPSTAFPPFKLKPYS